MVNNYRVLVLEDEQEDFELVKMELGKMDFKFTIRHVDGKAAFINALEEFVPDIILADYNLPLFNGMEALKIAKEKYPDIPFIIVSGTIGEETAVETLKQGATDYILKSRLSKLEHSIKRAIKETEEIAKCRKAEDDLRDSEKRYKRLLGSVTDYIYTVKIKDGQVISTEHGHGCIAVTGYSSKEYENDPGLWYRMIHDEDKGFVTKKISMLITGKDDSPFEHRIIHKNGEIRWIRNTPVLHYDENKSLIGYDGLISDITEKKKLEQEILQIQKMEAIGNLAGGIAHDFNNILTVIGGYSRLMSSSFSKEDQRRKDLEEIIKSGEKAKSLTSQLLAFSRKQMLNPRVIDLNIIVTDMEKMLQRLIGEDIKLVTILSPKPARVKADQGQIEQIILNLAVNARDAMPDGGTLTIKTENIVLDKEQCKIIQESAPGLFTRLSIEDTGAGMDKEVIGRIFEPFFTTKDYGKGTGMGLSGAYGIAKQHEGWINVYSEVRKGSIFKIYLPSSTSKSDYKIEKETKVIVEDLKGKGERILVVEDDSSIRIFSKRLLSKNNYVVLEAVNSQEALTIFDKEAGNIDMVFSDMILPDKNGLQLVEELISKKRNLKVILTSGYLDSKSQLQKIQEKKFKFIQKPYSVEELLKAIREII